MRPRRILVVDDDDVVARTLRLGLTSLGGYEVAVENRGTRALETARSFGPDLVLLDVIMPDRRGEEVLRDFRDADDMHDIPVFFLTAAIPEPASDGRGPDQWIRKPVSIAEVISEIETRLEPQSNP
jgi:CheY-like chemotaxis protein